ncbi:MAG: IS110 family transposase [Oligoflexales bacterium]|nr:IS110 family transposase [Oligoflexales bacterium]
MNNFSMSYRGKKVYIGIDVHKKSYVFTAICEDEIIKRARVDASSANFIQQLKDWFKYAQVYSAYEAGFSGFHLHRQLVTAGIKNIVVNPASIPVKANDKTKTDKRDSLKICQTLVAGMLKPIYVPSKKEELARLLPRTRDQLVKIRTKVGNQFKSKLYQFGLMEGQDDKIISQKFIDETLERTDLDIELEMVLEILAEQWKSLHKQICKIEKLMETQASKEPKIEKIYRSVPGVGEISSRILSTELGDMKRFSNQKKLFSYTGLTPSEYSSGPHIRKGHISRQGSNRLRQVLTEIAWRAIKEDPALRDSFERISIKAGKKKAIVGIARKIIGRMRACFMNNQEYQIGVGYAFGQV